MKFNVKFDCVCVDKRTTKNNKNYSVVNDITNMQYLNLFEDTNVCLQIGKKYSVVGSASCSDKGAYLNIDSVKEIQ